MNDADARAEGRREATPAALVVLLVYVLLAVVSWMKGWEIVGLPWWFWLVIGLPALLLAIDLVLTRQGRGIVQSRHAALVLLSLLVAGNFIGLTVLVAGLVTQSTPSLSGGELLFTGSRSTRPTSSCSASFTGSSKPVARSLGGERRCAGRSTSSSRRTRIPSCGVRLAASGWDYLYVR